MEHGAVLSSELDEVAGGMVLICDFVFDELRVEERHLVQVGLGLGHFVYLQLLLD